MKFNRWRLFWFKSGVVIKKQLSIVIADGKKKVRGDLLIDGAELYFETPQEALDFADRASCAVSEARKLAVMMEAAQEVTP